MYKSTRTGFKSRTEAQNTRRHAWVCLGCQKLHTAKIKACEECGGTDIHYFPSQAEVRRFGQLRMLERTGQIKKLELQPSYEIYGKKSGLKLFEYRADFRYIDSDGVEVVEDVKGTINEKYLDPVFKLKRRAMKAELGIDIKLVKA